MPKNFNVLKTVFNVDCKIESFYSGGPITVNKNGDRLFTNCGDHINCIDLVTGKVKFAIGLDESENEVSTFSISPSDDFLIVSYRNLLMKQWNLNDAENKADVGRVWKSGHRGPVTWTAFSDDSTILASGSSDSTVKVWDLQAQYCTHTLKNASGCISYVQFAPDSWNKDNKLILVFADDMGKVFVRNLKGDQNVLASLSNHSSAVTSIIFDEEFLYTTGRDSVIVQYDRRANFVVKRIIPTFEPIETMTFVDRIPVDSKLLAVNDKLLLTAGESGKLKIWSTLTSKCVYNVSVSNKPVVQITPCDETRSFIISTQDQIILSVKYDDFNVDRQFVGRNDEIYDAAFMSDDDDRIVLATNSHDVRIYDLKTLNCQLLNGHSDAILALDVPVWDKKTFATCSKDNKIFVWREVVGSTKVHFAATGHTNSVTGVRFSRTKPTFLASISDDRTLKLWKLPSNFLSTEQDANEPQSLTASSTVIAHDKDISGVDVSPNDRIVATSSMDKTVKLWNVSPKLSLSPLGTINEHKRGVWDVKFSPTDQVLASCSGDCTVKIFALEDLSCLKTFEGHQSAVLRVSFVTNGLQLMSADTAGLIKLWTIRTNECVRTFDGHENKIYALNLNGDGDKMISGGADAQVFVWRDDTEIDRSDNDLKRRELIENEQKLSNLLDKHRYADALRLALTLNRPFNALKILKKMFSDQDDGLSDVESTLKSLKIDQINVLLTYLIEWNSNSRNFYVAQLVLSAIFKFMSPDELLKLPNIKEVVEGLTPYSERHFERLSKTRQQACFVDFTWRTLKIAGSDPTLRTIKNEPE